MKADGSSEDPKRNGAGSFQPKSKRSVSRFLTKRNVLLVLMLLLLIRFLGGVLLGSW